MSSWVFLKDVARRPGQMGAIAPSGSQLARLMVDAADLRPEHVVVELGAGSGSITRFIHARVPDSPVLAFEPGSELAAGLRASYPSIRVTERLAHEMSDALEEWGHDAVDRVISGLPWALWPMAVQEQILDAVVVSLRPGGRFVTFQYVHSQLLPGAGALRTLLGRYFTRVEKTPVAWLNLPPAFAFVADGPKPRL